MARHEKEAESLRHTSFVSLSRPPPSIYTIRLLTLSPPPRPFNKYPLVFLFASLITFQVLYIFMRQVNFTE